MAGRLRVGVDLVDADDVSASIDAFGDAYLARVYTAREVADCSGDAGLDPSRLAARFAAKEAVVKVLRRPVDISSWRTIEVVRAPGGWCSLELTGPAAELAAAEGIDELSLSISHEGHLATAVVVASCES